MVGDTAQIDSSYISYNQSSIEMNEAIHSAQTLVCYCEKFIDKGCQGCPFDTARGCAVHMPFIWHSNFLRHKKNKH